MPDQMLAAARAVGTGAGVVFVVKNYTGDVMNFRLAAELATEEGIEVRTVLVDDDVAVGASTATAGRRGTGATVLVEKIAGALAERGGGLDAVAALGERVNAASRSFAVATMVDAYTPALAAFEQAVDGGAGLADAASGAADAAEQGMRDTVALQARKGRASYLGPRSIGHQDPGATSTALLFRALADATRPI